MVTCRRRRLGWVVAVAWVGLGCGLDAQTRYRCEDDKTCFFEGFRCGSDGFCYGPDEALPEKVDAGKPPRCGAAADVCEDHDAECGFVDDPVCGQPVFCGYCLNATECGVDVENRCGTPRVCVQGYCWENPLPQGADLTDLYAADERHVWLTTSTGTILFWNGEHTEGMAIPFVEGQRWYAIDGAGQDLVVAVGNKRSVLVYDGVSWAIEVVTAAPEDALFRSVAATADGVVVAMVGPHAYVRATPAPAGQGVWALVADLGGYGAQVSSSDAGVFALTDKGSLYRLTLTGSQNVEPVGPAADADYIRHLQVVEGQVFAISLKVVSSTLVYRLIRLDLGAPDDGWVTVWEPPMGYNPLRSFDTLDGRVLWLVTDYPDMIRRLEVQPDGTLASLDEVFAQQKTELRKFYVGVRAFSSGRAVAVGQRGAMAFLMPDGGFVTAASASMPYENMNELCASPDGALGAAAAGNNFFRRDLATSSWVRQQLPTSLLSRPTMLSCSMQSEGRGWVVGSLGVVVSIDEARGAPVAVQLSSENDFLSVVQTEGAGIALLGRRSSSDNLYLNADGQARLSSFNVYNVPDGLKQLAWTGTSLFGVGLNGHIGQLGVNTGWVERYRQGPDLNSLSSTVTTSGQAIMAAAGRRGTLLRFTAAPGPIEVVDAGAFDFADIWLSRGGDVYGAGASLTQSAMPFATSAPALVVVSADGGVALELLPIDRTPTSVIGVDLDDTYADVWVSAPNGVILRRELR